MTEPHDIAAVFFDMDGTLIDSELNTGPAITSVCRDLGLPEPKLDYPAFYGKTWSSVVEAIAASDPAFAEIPDLAMRLHKAFHHLCLNRESIEATIEQLGIGEQIRCYVGAEDFERSKPAPDCFLHAASLLKASPGNCLVFEDSVAGLGAARAAGMWAIAITHRSNDIDRARELGHRAIDNYTELAEDFVARTCA